MTYWTNKRVAVTGAGSGIGKALSSELISRGAEVWLSDINGEAVASVATALGDRAHSSTLNVTDAGAFRNHITEITDGGQHIDALFNNAGIGIGGDMLDMEAEHFDRSVDVNVRGVTNGVVAVYRTMAEQGGGVIVNTASAAGLMGIPLMAAYAMTKHAVVGLSQSMRIEGAEHNIQVNALCPTAIETPILDAEPEVNAPPIWRPDIRTYLTEVGGAPYPVEKFARYALDQVERNIPIIVAPRGARVRLALARWLPGLTGLIGNRAYKKMLAEKPG